MTAKRTALPREGISDMAIRVGVSRQALSKWKKEGTDIWDESALEDRIQEMREGTGPRGGAGGTPDYSAARAEKEHHMARHWKAKADEAEGVTVPLEEAIKDAMQTGLIEQQSWLKMPEELIPMLTGLESGAMMKVARKYARQKLEENAEAYESINSFSIRTPPSGGDATTAGNATKRVGGKKRPPAKQRVRKKVSSKRGPGSPGSS